MAGDVLPDHLFLFLLLRVVDDDLEHETVYLRLGQRVGAFLLDGVLRGHDEEGGGELVGRFADGHLSLLHGF